MRVELSNQAQLDLEQIGDFIARDNPLRAETFIRELADRCATLSEFPRRFPSLQRHEASGLRKAVHGSYMIVFRIDASIVVVTNVLHGASDFEARLFPD